MSPEASAYKRICPVEAWEKIGSIILETFPANENLFEANQHEPGTVAWFNYKVRRMAIPRLKNKQREQAHIKAIKMIQSGKYLPSHIARATGLDPAQITRHRHAIRSAEDHLRQWTGGWSFFSDATKSHAKHIETAHGIAHAERGSHSRDSARARSKRHKAKTTKAKMPNV